MNKPLKKNVRMALLLSGGTDALLGACLLLVGLDLLPIDVRGMGFENWQVLLTGAIVFAAGVGMIAYILSRFKE